MKTMRILELLGLGLGLASLATAFMIVPALIMAPIGALVSAYCLLKTRPNRLAITGLALNLISILILITLYFIFRDLGTF